MAPIATGTDTADTTEASTGEASTGEASTGEASTGEPTWSNGIADIIRDNCVRCHASGQFATYAPLQSYEQVVARQVKMRQKIREAPSWGTQMPPYPGGAMPGSCEPQHPYSNDLRMAAEDIEALLSWIQDGTPRGDDPQPSEPLLGAPPATLIDATEYPFVEGFVMTIDADHDTGHADEYVCVVVDPGTIAGSRFISGLQINPGIPQVFRGAVVWLDEDRESLRYLQADSPRLHGADWYDCEEGFGFEGPILGGFLPEGEPITTPPGSAAEIPGDALIVYKIHYHAHYDHVNPDDTYELPFELQWPDHTSLSIQWKDRADVQVRATMLTFGNDDGPVVNGTGNLTAPFRIPVASSIGQGHVETMVTQVPGGAGDAFAVWAVQPEMKHVGRTVAVSVGNQAASSYDCLATNPRWEATWQVPMTFDLHDAPVVRGGDRLRIDCVYMNNTGMPLTLQHESCRAMVGLVPID